MKCCIFSKVLWNR